MSSACCSARNLSAGGFARLVFAGRGAALTGAAFAGGLGGALLAGPFATAGRGDRPRAEAFAAGDLDRAGRAAGFTATAGRRDALAAGFAALAGALEAAFAVPLAAAFAAALDGVGFAALDTREEVALARRAAAVERVDAGRAARAVDVAFRDAPERLALPALPPRAGAAFPAGPPFLAAGMVLLL